MANFNYASFIWGVADKLRGAYKRAQYGKVILPFVVLRRLDCVLEATKAAVLEEAAKTDTDNVARDFLLQKKSGYAFYNTSPYDLQKLTGDPTNLRSNLQAYIAGFSPNIQDVFERYEIDVQLKKLDDDDLLLLIVQEFLKIDLHPAVVDNATMGHIFEDLIAKAMEASNEEAGEYFTPRDVVRLMVNLLFARDDEMLSRPGVVRSIYDPTAGTGGMLSVAEDYIKGLNPDAELTLYGQERNDESYAIAKTDLLIKGQSADNIVCDDTLMNDGHWDKTFDYGLANPPFGVEWKKQQEAVNREHEQMGFNGRFGAGLPRVNDGSLLFLMHLVSKMRPVSEGGGRIGIVLNGSPLFTGAAGSGESEIRRWLLDNDLVEAIVGLPKDMFYNTGIATYIWLLDNEKPAERRGKIQLIDGTEFYKKLRKNVGDKKNEITPDDIRQIVTIYDAFEVGQYSQILTKDDFAYTTITVEQPSRLSWSLSSGAVDEALGSNALQKLEQSTLGDLRHVLLEASKSDSSKTFDSKEFTARIKSLVVDFSLTAPQLKALVSGFAQRDDNAPIVLDAKGNPVPDKELRDTENVPFKEQIEEYAAREISPYLTDYWIDRSKDKLGFEIPFIRYFYKYEAPRQLREIDEDLEREIAAISKLLKDMEK